MAAYATTDLLLDSLAPSTPLRPILTRLNADNSWMMSLPRPGGPDASGKAYYHVLQDLWLGGSLTEWPYTAFLFKIVRTQAGQFDDVADIERLVASLEAAAAGGGAERAADATTTTKQRQGVDAILVSHTNIDHCHRATLERFPRETPVLVVADAAALVRGWGHFETVVELPDLEPAAASWPVGAGAGAGAGVGVEAGSDGTRSVAAVPAWLRMFRLPDRDSLYPHIHHGIVTSWGGEALLYAPHGVDAHKAAHAARVAPEGTAWLALLHGLDELGTGTATGRGVRGGLALAEATGVRYWARTHDGGEAYSGVISWLLRFRGWTFEEGVAEMERRGGKMDAVPAVFDIENGGALVLV
ncbi:hypothetical protein VD0002_g1738 [Verticillium dahliae]|nr:hypothetical protein VD0002_g1738 [Verticillium dahliae]